ncbi:hypothetical protein ACTXT7_016234 [Hymenolepis weldensis]
MSRCPSLAVMKDTRLGIFVQAHKHTAGPPADTVVEILSPSSASQFSPMITMVLDILGEVIRKL